jgi:hypothetical protein
MNMAAFQDAAPAWAAAGIVPLPIEPNGKRPMVKHPGTFGRPAALRIVPKFPDANLGFWCGSHNRLTVVDVDSAADAELQQALATYGDSPIIVQTASGGRHAYYRHDGERRRIRPDKQRPVDILGEGGLAVAPPSVRPSGGKYAFLRGGLADLAGLPKIRGGVLQSLEPALSRLDEGIHRSSADAARIGRRNDTLFRVALALGADSQDELLAQARAANVELSDPPSPDDEVQRAVGSAWGYKMRDRLMVPGTDGAIILPAASIARLLAAGETDAMALLALLRKAHSGRRQSFAASPEAMERARLIGSWGKRRYRDATRKLCEVGELVQVSQGGKGRRTPSLYRFGLRGLD